MIGKIIILVNIRLWYLLHWLHFYWNTYYTVDIQKDTYNIVNINWDTHYLDRDICYTGLHIVLTHKILSFTFGYRQFLWRTSLTTISFSTTAWRVVASWITSHLPDLFIFVNLSLLKHLFVICKKKSTRKYPSVLLSFLCR